LNEHEAAEYLGLKVKTLQMHRYKKTGPPFHRDGRKIRYDFAELREWAEKSPAFRIKKLGGHHAETP